MTSLFELMLTERPAPDLVLTTLREYAEGGSSILYESVRTILDKTTLTIPQLRKAADYMNMGAKRQLEMHCPREVVIYEQARQEILERLAKVETGQAA